MKKHVTPIVAAALLAATPALAEGKLTVTTYGGSYTESQREAYYKPFESEMGIPVQEEVASEVWPTVKAQIDAGNVTWDVVTGETSTIILGCDTGLLEPIDWSLIDQTKLIPDAIQECGVGTIVQSSVMAYDADKITGDVPTTAADFFDLTKYPGKRAMRKSPSTTLEFALIGDGVAKDEVYQVLSTPEGLDRAFAKLDSIKDQVIWWEASSQPMQLLSDGEVAMTTSWSGRVTTANRKDGKHFEIIWDGQNYDVDFFAVIRGAPHKEDAMKFIAFATDPNRQAKQMEYISYGPTHVDAGAMLPEGLAEQLPNYPDNLAKGIKNDSAFWADNLDTLQARFQAWLTQ